MVFENVLGFEFPSLVVVAIILLVITMVIYRDKTPSNLPPCPAYAFPLVGHLPYIAKDPRAKIMEWSKKKGEIFSLYFGSTLVVVFSSFDVLKETLIRQADLFTDKPKNGMLPIMKITEGIISNSGASWKENRSTVLTILRSFGMGKNVMAEKVTEEINAYLEEIAKFQGKPADPKDITVRAVSNIVCNFLLGKRFEYSDEYYRNLLDLYEHLINVTQAGTLQMWFPWVKYLPGDLFQVKKCRVLDDQIIVHADEFIKAAEDENNSETNKTNIIYSYMGEMRTKQEKGQPTLLNKEGMRRVIVDLLTAGSETVASTVLYFYLYMIHHPHIQDKVLAEIDEKIGPHRAPTIADKANLTYVNATIMETQRLASIVPLGLFHRCTEETTVQGYTIPKDTYIMPHLDSVLHSEEIWGDPSNFRPERFIDDKGNLLNPEYFVPFSIGRRSCVAEALAKAELFLFIAHIFHSYKVEPANPNSLPGIDSILGITCCPTPYEIAFVNRRA